MQIGRIAAQHHRAARAQFHEQRHMPGGMSGGFDGANAWRDLMVSGLYLPLRATRDFVFEHAAVQLRCRGRQLFSVDVDIAAGQIAKTARVVEVQVPEEHEVDVRGVRPSCRK